MIFNPVLRRLNTVQNRISFCTATSQTSKILISEQGEAILDEDIEKTKIGRLNVSRLQPAHRNILLNEIPYDRPNSWVHQTEGYQRKLFGRYGAKSGVDPKVCFPTKEDKMKEARYEAVAYPLTLQQMMDISKAERQKRRDMIKKREDDISAKLEKLDKWKQELNDKIAKKEADALAAKTRKERMIEEIRRHFGFKVDPRDERFKEMLEQKEKEDKKMQKEAKRKAKEEKMMSKLLSKSSEPVEKNAA